MNRISKDNTILVAILTESGAPFSEKGIDYVKDMIVEVHPEMKDFPIIAMMGEAVRKPYQVYTLLSANPEAFVIISHDGGGQLSLYRPGENPELLRALEVKAVTEQNKTAWQLFTEDDREEDMEDA